MTDPRDDRVSSAYREMPGQGPSPAIDAAIQAAARRAVGSRPGRSPRWEIPVSIAAVLALAVGISLHVDREKPVVMDGGPVPSERMDYPTPGAEPEKKKVPMAPATPSAPEAALPKELSPAPAAPAKTPALEEKRAATAADRVGASAPAPATAPAPAPRSAPFPMEAPVRLQAPVPLQARVPTPPPATPAHSEAAMPLDGAARGNLAPPAAAPSASSAASSAPASAMRVVPQGAQRAKAEMARDAISPEKPLAESPEQRLQRIADLRVKGLDDEADKALAEFRRAYPEYRLSDDWLRKVERR